MCGIVGFMGSTSIGPDAASASVLQRMTDSLTSRGPDSGGYWTSEGIALGHRRLAVLDLSAAGEQPMHSQTGRYVIIFNGEIYNHLELRKTLSEEGYMVAWRGHSDTETLLAGFEFWGVRSTVEKCVGMFSFAVWDAPSRRLTLGRDRIGEKPLYYGWQRHGGNDVFLFASELKALKVHESFEGLIDRSSLSLFMRHNYVPAPGSIYQGISKLMPGCLLSVSSDSPECKIERYWDGVEVARKGSADIFEGSHSEAIDELERILSRSVKDQMISDVPLGAFLSGGIDSSVIVALMQQSSARQVKTFTIGFREAKYNEAPYAKAVANHLATEHTEIYVSPKDVLDVVPLLPVLYDEPFADSSQIPTYLVSKIARSKVTVALSGDGGDELFCGYNRYKQTGDIWRKLRFVPLPVRGLMRRGITSLSPRMLNSALGGCASLVSQRLAEVNLGDKIHKAAKLFEADSFDDVYRLFTSHWNDPAAVVISGDNGQSISGKLLQRAPELDKIERLMLLDMLTYLPDDILTKVDRAAMGVSLETRVPLLDHRLVEFAWRLPLSMKLHDGETKWLLRQVAYRHVPKELLERPKMGFAVPLSMWLRGPLREWAEEMLDESKIRRDGYFYPEEIKKKWTEHLSGERNWEHLLWNVIMFQAWLSTQ